MADELKPCPFCGGAAAIVLDQLRHGDMVYRVECGTRECGIGTLGWFPQAAAVQSWNRRVPDPRHAILLVAARAVLASLRRLRPTDQRAATGRPIIEADAAERLRRAVEACEDV